MLLKLYRTNLGPVLIAYNTIEFAQAVPINHHFDKINSKNAPAVAQTDLHFLHDDSYAAALAQSEEVQSFAEIAKGKPPAKLPAKAAPAKAAPTA